MVWWIAAKLLAPLAKGALGTLLKVALLGAVVVAAMVLVGLDPVAIGVSVASSAVDTVVNAIAEAVADAVADKVSL